MAEAHYEEALAVCRGMWEFAAVLDFLARYREQLGLPEADADTLERALVYPYHSEALEVTHVRLLQQLQQQEEANLFSWPRVLFAALAGQLAYLRWLEGEGAYEALAAEAAAEAAAPRPASLVQATLQARARYEALGVGMRVRILHELCGRVLDAPATRAALVDGLCAGACATAPLGSDGMGRQYWFFSGVPRLFRGTPPAAAPAAAAEGQWETCAADEAQWAALLQALAESDQAADRLLHGVLARTVAPQLRRLAAERRAAVQRELQQMPRKRSSRLQEKLLQAREPAAAEALDQAASVEQVKLYHEGRLQEMLRAEEEKARAREARQLEQQRREEELEAARAKEREEKERARVARRQRRASSIGEEYLEAALEQMGALAGRKAAPEPVEDPVLDRPCVPCRKGHVRCDRQFPCGRCAKKGMEDACEESVTGRRPFEEAARIRAEKEARLRALTEGMDAAHAQQAGQQEGQQETQQEAQQETQQETQQEAQQETQQEAQQETQQETQQEAQQEAHAAHDEGLGEKGPSQPGQQQERPQVQPQEQQQQPQEEQQQPNEQPQAQVQPQEQQRQLQAQEQQQQQQGVPEAVVAAQAVAGARQQGQQGQQGHNAAATAAATGEDVSAQTATAPVNGSAAGAVAGAVAMAVQTACAGTAASTAAQEGVLGKRVGEGPQDGAKRPRQGPL